MRENRLMNSFWTIALPAALLFACSFAKAADAVDPQTLYVLSTDGSTAKVKSGEKGTVVIAIRTKAGAHVSEEAPLKVALSGKNVTLDKVALTGADSVGKKAPGQQYADPRFEVPVRGEAPGGGVVEAKVTFFICTDKLCTRQQRNLSVPIEVL